MIFTNHNTVFTRQNFWLKLVILMTGLVASVIITMKALVILLIVSTIYTSLSKWLWKDISKGLKIMLPFFAAYSVMALIFNIQFPDVIVFILRIICLVILLVYFVASTPIHRFMQDISSARKHTRAHTPLFYFIATSLYLKHFLQYYKDYDNQNMKKKKSIKEIIPDLVEAIHANWQHRDTIESETDEILSGTYIRPPFICKSNIIGCIYLTLQILILSV